MLAHCDWQTLYPFQSHYLSLDGWNYHFVDEGQGSPLLCVHGNPTWSFHWRELIKTFRDRYRIIAPDHMGCGLSDKPQDYPYVLSQHILNLRRVVKQLDLRQITLVAHDWGGAIGLGAALAEPDRYERFVLMNTGAFRSSQMPWRIRACRIPLLGTLAVRGLNAFLKAAFYMATANSSGLPRLVRAGYESPYTCWRDRIAIDRFVKDIPLSAAHPSYETLVDIETQLPMIQNKPIQFIWGMRDWCFTSWFLNRFLETFPRADVCRVAHAGHWVVEDARDEVMQCIDLFLHRHPLHVEASTAKPFSI